MINCFTKIITIGEVFLVAFELIGGANNIAFTKQREENVC